MRNYVFGLFWWVLAGATLLAGCGDDSESTPPPPPSAKLAPAPAKLAPLTAAVFLEYSGGMRGFMPAGSATATPTEFQRRIGSLLTETKVSPVVASSQFFLLDKNGAPQPQPFTKLLQTVEGLNAQAALGTELPEMLERIMARPGADQEVSVVISDFIYGPKVKADFAVLPNLIRAAIAPVSKQQLAVAVLGEKSRFYGTYHPAVKTPVAQRQLKGELVPYYCWVIGPPALVSRYLNQVAKTLPAEQAYYGFSVPAPPAQALFTKLRTTSLQATGSVYADPNATPPATGRDIAADLGDGPAEFSVGLNLAALPPAWQQAPYLRQRLQVQFPQGKAALLSVQELTAAQKANDPALAAYTHTARLQLSALPAGAAAPLTLMLPAADTSAWVSAWATPNDNQPSGRTFGLDQVLRGVRECYPAALPPVFNLSFSVRDDQ